MKEQQGWTLEYVQQALQIIDDYIKEIQEQDSSDFNPVEREIARNNAAKKLMSDFEEAKAQENARKKSSEVILMILKGSSS